ELGWLQEMLQCGAARFRRRTPHGEVNHAILCSDPANHCQNRFYTSRKFRGDDSERVAFVLDQLSGATFTAESIGERPLKRSFTNECRGHPYARRPGCLQYFDTRC